MDLEYSDEFLILYFTIIIEDASIPHINTRIDPHFEELTEILLKSIAPTK